MSLIVMVVYCTPDNGRYEYTEQTLENLFFTVDWRKHKMVMVDNGSDERTKRLLGNYELSGCRRVITNTENLGTARAVNQGLSLREANQHCIKIDNDVTVHTNGWVDELEEAIERDPTIGVLGLKRKDLRQTPYDPDPDFRSEYVQLPHQAGQRWVTVERSRDIMGTCTMYNWRLIDAIGGLAQPTQYSFDDTLYGLRSLLAGFWNGFLSHIEIEHIDTGQNPYSKEKIEQAAQAWETYHKMHKGYIDGTIPLKVEI